MPVLIICIHVLWNIVLSIVLMYFIENLNTFFLVWVCVRRVWAGGDGRAHVRRGYVRAGPRRSQ